MSYQTTLERTRFEFPNLRCLFAKATPLRSGDVLAGVAVEGPVERLAAQMALAKTPFKDFLAHDVLVVDGDEVSDLIATQHNPEAFRAVSALTVGEFRNWLLDEATTDAELARLTWALTPEMVAVSKIMRNHDLIVVAAKRKVMTRFRSTVGLLGRLSTRNQPNHPTDDSLGIAASAIEGLALGSGDAVIGVNPAIDTVEDYIRIVTLLDDLRVHLEIPTQTYCLGHVTVAIKAIEAGAPVDLVFQSVAGS